MSVPDKPPAIPPRDPWLSQRWEAFAQEDAEFYIWTEGDDFWESGEQDAARIWGLAKPHVARRRTVLEIGCGVGRLLLPMRRHFDAAIGVDVAPTMLEKLEANAARAGVGAVRGLPAGDAWEALAPIDFAYSHIVLQHIERWDIIADYFARVRQCLASDGAFYAHFDTRPRTAAYRLRNLLPERVLPRTMKRGVRRIRRSADDVRALASQSGFATIDESGANTTETVFLLKRR